MKQALVIGGTGMLKEVCIWLTEQDFHVTVVARYPVKMEALIAAASPEKITPVLADYMQTAQLKSKLQGQYDLIIAWVHSGGEAAVQMLLAKTNEFYHVLGSRADLKKIKEGLKIPESCNYHQVQLGFILQGESSRWLKNSEIAAGVIEAVKRKQPRSLVGTIEPWEKRP
ncbi:short chain dehydrogenase [Bacillus sp. THAF10]|uniref:short-chain dehydrogenase n=1 Tax=Bacillus sp. THAF10 TaxID=2587848 RepID=UPI00126907EB|nr:short-chain dehydrogenase [Bacillus sp. THAF10]QFT87520.1 short chain dehydrogenase [Bacillus sp. THAF10]